MSIWHIIILAAYVFLLVNPAMIIFRRAGYNPWLGLLAAVPVLNLVFLWVFSLAKWPAMPNQNGTVA